MKALFLLVFPLQEVVHIRMQTSTVISLVHLLIIWIFKSSQRYFVNFLMFLSVLLRYNWIHHCISLRCIAWLFEWLASLNDYNSTFSWTPIILYNIKRKKIPLWWELKIYSLNHFHINPTTLLTIIIILYTTSTYLFVLSREHPLHLFLPPPTSHLW